MDVKFLYEFAFTLTLTQQVDQFLGVRPTVIFLHIVIAEKVTGEEYFVSFYYDLLYFPSQIL